MSKHHTHTCECGRPSAGTWLCPGCTKTLTHAIVNISYYWADLDTVRGKHTRYTTHAPARGSVGKTIPLPIDHRFTQRVGTGSQLASDTCYTLTVWTRITADTTHTTPPATADVPGMSRYLATHQREIVRQHWVGELLDELLDLESRLRRFIDRPPETWYAGRCRVADDYGECTTELYAISGARWVDCPGCGIRHDIRDRRERLLAEAADHHVTAYTAALALVSWTDRLTNEAKLMDRIRRWRDRGKLHPVDVTALRGRDRHLYRLGDIQDLLAGTGKCRGAERRAL